jgi:hypothetical protein
MNLENFELAAVDLPGLLMVRHSAGGLLAKYDADGDKFTTKVSRSLYDAIPKVTIDLSGVPDPEDAYWWHENHELGIASEDQKRWVLEKGSVGTVYFIANAETGMIKIGFTSNLRQRMTNYRGHNVGDFDVWHMPGSRNMERILLQRFRPIRRQGEWHYPHLQLIKYVMGAEPYVPTR